jgi:hypothetical protein
MPRCFVQAGCNIGLVLGKIQPGFGLCQHIQAAFPPCFRRPAKRAAGKRQRLGALAGGFRGDQIRQALDLRQVHAAIGKGPAGEFSRLCQPYAGLGDKFSQHRRDNSDAAVQVQLCQIFTTGGVWAGKNRDQRLIERRAMGVDQGAKRQAARRRQR